MIVLGVDGMDPVMLARFMADGDTPNLKRLAATSGLVPLATAVPPQSPVAWSDFITGMDAGGHGIRCNEHCPLPGATAHETGPPE